MTIKMAQIEVYGDKKTTKITLMILKHAHMGW